MLDLLPKHAQANISTNCAEQIDRTVLGVALHILPLELLDLHVVWPSSCVLLSDLSGYCQLHWCCFPVNLCNPLHPPYRLLKKGGLNFDFLRLFSTFVHNIHFIYVFCSCSLCSWGCLHCFWECLVFLPLLLVWALSCLTTRHDKHLWDIWVFLLSFPCLLLHCSSL